MFLIYRTTARRFYIRFLGRVFTISWTRSICIYTYGCICMYVCSKLTGIFQQKLIHNTSPALSTHEYTSTSSRCISLYIYIYEGNYMREYNKNKCQKNLIWKKITIITFYCFFFCARCRCVVRAFMDFNISKEVLCAWVIWYPQIILYSATHTQCERVGKVF